MTTRENSDQVLPSLFARFDTMRQNVVTDFLMTSEEVKKFLCSPLFNGPGLIGLGCSAWSKMTVENPKRFEF